MFSFTGTLSNGLFAFIESSKDPAVVKNRVDNIVDRVSKLLDMYPADLHFTINIYPNNRDIERAFRDLGGLRALEGAPIAFYAHKRNTIYVSIEKLTPGVLAHEIAHAIINVYFDTPPPERMQEILAQYVDKHLWEE